MKGFNYYQDTKKEWRWKLLDGNHEIVADSAEGYNAKSDCEKSAELFKALGPTAPERKAIADDAKGEGPEWEYYEDRAAEWRWRFQARNNKIIADSAEGYATESGVKRAIANVKALLTELAAKDKQNAFQPSTGSGNSAPGRFA